MGCGDQHVVVLCSKNADDDTEPQLEIPTEPVLKQVAPKKERVKSINEESKEPVPANIESSPVANPAEEASVEKDVVRSDEIFNDAPMSQQPASAENPIEPVAEVAAPFELSQTSQKRALDLGSDHNSGLGSQKMLHE